MEWIAVLKTAVRWGRRQTTPPAAAPPSGFRPASGTEFIAGRCVAASRDPPQALQLIGNGFFLVAYFTNHKVAKTTA